MRQQQLNTTSLAQARKLSVREKEFEVLVARRLHALEAELIALTTNIDPTAVTKKHSQQARLHKLIVAVNALIATCFTALSNKINKNIKSIVRHITMGAQAALDATIPSEITSYIKVSWQTKRVSTEYIEELCNNALIDGLTQREWWRKQSTDFSQKFLREMRQGLSYGEELSELIRRIRGRRENKFRDGITSMSTRNAQALARTSLHSVANQARLSQYQANSDVLSGLELSVTLDERLSKICQARRGLKYALDGKPLGHAIPFNGGPPYHFNCRTQIIPILKPLSDIIN